MPTPTVCYLVREIVSLRKTASGLVESLAATKGKTCKGWAPCKAPRIPVQSSSGAEPEEALLRRYSVSGEGAALHTCTAPDHAMKPHNDRSGCCLCPAIR